METAEIIYEGELITQAKHLKSGSILTTDAPLDNNGKGSTFSPTDLMSVSLVSCMLTIIGINAEKHNMDVGKVKAMMTKTMGTNPRRVIEIKVDLFFEKNFPDEIQKQIEDWGLNCPVAKSLHPDLVQNVKFNFGNEI